MNRHITHTLRAFGLAIIFAAGCAAGHYHGKAQTLERVYEKQVSVNFNPIALEQLK
jgi:hypothetical protein